MREFVAAVRAIWDCWNHGTELDFRGDFYTHTLMPPLFRLDPCPQGPPPIVLAGVGPLMTETAGEVGDGYIAHGFTTGDYLREVTLPRLARGRERAGRTLEGFDTRGLALVATGHTEEQLERSVAEVREWLSFYGSTPAYAPVLEHHGWGDLHAELHRLSRSDGWAAMPALIDDEVLRTLAFVGEPREIGPQVLARYGDVFTRMSFYRPSEYVPEVWADVLDGFRTAQSAPAR
jgi:probable F420-dependent oxidoreductase